MYELPVAALLADRVVRGQFDPKAPPEPEPDPRLRSFRPVRRTRLLTAAALQRAARAVEPRPECTPAH